MNRVDADTGRLVLFLILAVSLCSTASLHAQEFPPPIVVPPGPVRIPAEFEPMQAVVVKPIHPHGMVPRAFFEDVVEQVTLIVLCPSEEQMETSKDACRDWGFDLDRCVHIRVPFVDTTRDILPWLMFTGDGEPAFVFNRYCAEPSCADINIILYGQEQGYPIYRSGLNVDGGNFMTDGQGTAAGLDDVYLDNADILDGPEDRLADFWGVHTCHFIADDYKGSDGYLHIDCMAKFLRPDTVMVVRVPPTDIRHEQSEAAAAYFARQISCWGTPYRVRRIDVPDQEPYINALIVNHKVYVPTMDRPADANAIAAYEAAMPGYEVMGLSSPLGKHGGSMWLSFWALHCETMGIADEQMLYIEHVPVLDRPATAEGFPLCAKVLAHSGAPLVGDTPTVLWRVQGQEDWSQLPMAPRPDLGEDRYATTIPAQPTGTAIEYYLHAEDASGRSENHPYIGAPQAHTFTVKPFGADVSAVSAAKGGPIHLYLNAGADHALTDYRIRCTLDIQDPCTPAEELPEDSVFTGFEGALNDLGIATAELLLPPASPSHWVGSTLHLDLIINQSQETIVDRVTLTILD